MNTEKQQFNEMLLRVGIKSITVGNATVGLLPNSITVERAMEDYTQVIVKGLIPEAIIRKFLDDKTIRSDVEIVGKTWAEPTIDQALKPRDARGRYVMTKEEWDALCKEAGEGEIKRLLEKEVDVNFVVGIEKSIGLFVSTLKIHSELALYKFARLFSHLSLLSAKVYEFNDCE